MALRVSDQQSDSDLDSIRSSCDVSTCSSSQAKDDPTVGENHGVKEKISECPFDKQPFLSFTFSSSHNFTNIWGKEMVLGTCCKLPHRKPAQC